jgi:3-oxoacyl-[acyl-carrier protein] reductase
MNISLKGRRAFVGGASQGIGLAIAEKMAACGATITLVSRNAEKLKAALAHLPRPARQKHDFLAVDFSDLKKLEKALEKYQIKTADLPVSILVLNSGGPAPTPVMGATPPQYQAYFNAAILASQLLVQAFVPKMREMGYGRIISVASSTVKIPKLELGISNTIRAAAANWAKSLANELGGDGITVNNLLTGFIQTERLESLLESRMAQTGLPKEKIIANMTASIPAGRIGAPEDMGNAAVFLASDFAAYINGVNLPVDGGLLGTL